MARPRAVTYDDRVQSIIEHAAELFATRGFAGASIADIAEAAGISKALVYHYFRGKDEILYQLLRVHMAALSAAMARAHRSGSEPEAQFRALLRETMDIYATARHKHMLLLNELDALAPEHRAEIVAAERRLIADVTDLLARISPARMAKPRHRRPYAMLFYGMINWTYTWFRADGPVSPGEFADMAANIFLDGFRSADGGPSIKAVPIPTG
ncbi:MAG TPA: TetR/AcrR family transcriptional regulator [Candidatus Cybelea sp.]|nr:TetR/AcrR family transcriptional regulator [Candidatus Cybelea sp.]